MKSFYVTTTLPYVNSDPHIGFAVEIIRADIIARYKRINGFDVFFNTGTDEHGLKIYKKALEQGKDPQKYVDEYAEKFRNLKEYLNLSFTNFIRTTDLYHIEAAQKFWKICLKNNDIYKKNYKIKYCIGCELEKTESELVNNKCAEHPNLDIEIINEENYFFKFSKYREELLNLYENNPQFVIPSSRLNEIKTFVESGIEDFSISRIKNKMPWGIPVPDDNDHVMYVWFDALINYISTIGWPTNQKAFKKWWPAVQYCGKDNLRQQSAMWQAMLKSAGLSFSKHIIINGFVISDGKKMSKSFGNVINPIELVNEYGVDAFRYFVAHKINCFDDTDVTKERFKEIYNANLANNLGNLIQRILKMTTSSGIYLSSEDIQGVNNDFKNKSDEEVSLYSQYLDSFDINRATEQIWNLIKKLNFYIQDTRPFDKIKTNSEEAKVDLLYLLKNLFLISLLLEPIMPKTAETIIAAVKENKLTEPLFPRKD